MYESTAVRGESHLSRKVAERIRGSLTGFAAGIAAGSELTSVTSTSEDLELPLRLGESYVARGRLDPEDIGARWIAWLRSGPQDLGGMNREILMRAIRPSDLARVAIQVREERGHRLIAGNGGLVRALPVILVTAGDPRMLAEVNQAVSLLQGDEICVQACQVLARALEVLVLGGNPAESFEAAEDIARDLGSEVEGVFDAIRKAPRDSGFSGGYILNTLQLAMRVLVTSQDFASGIEGVVAREGDRSTNAAVAGALLGAVFEDAGIPARMRMAIRDRARVTSLVDGLLALRD